MIVETPDGEVEFPDNMSNDAIQGVLRKKYGFKEPPPDVPLFSMTGQDKAGEWLNTAIRSGTYNLADLAAAGIDKVFGGPDLATLRAQAKTERADLGGLGAMSADIAGHLANPLNRLGGSSIPALMGSGAVQSGVSALGAGDDWKTAGEAAVIGAAGGGAVGVGGTYLATKPFLSNVVRHYTPVAAGWAGGGPLGALAVHSILPAMQKVTANPNPWLNPYLNAAPQGILSGRIADTAPTQ